MLLKHLIELQSSEALLFHKNLSDYIHSVAQLIFRTDLHTMKVKKLAIYGMYKIVTTMIYNQGQIQNEPNKDGPGKYGLLISPMRFRNLEPQLLEAAQQYRHMMEMPDPTSKNEEDINRQDGARQLI